MICPSSLRVIVAALAVFVADRSAPAAEVTPADVLVQVELAQSDLEAIRFAMGRPENDQPEIAVRGAAPREVYFQALTLFRNADRLAFEHTRQHAIEPATPAGEIGPADVRGVVVGARQRIGLVLKELGIEPPVQTPQSDPTKTPTDVFRAIVQANRQLNLLLEQQFAPSDVFQQVTVGISFAASLLAQFPDATRIPDPPEFEPGKRPGDVYRRLVECFERVQRIAKRLDLEMLQLDIDQQQVMKAVPSDVYDVASLVVSELAYLHAHAQDTRPPRKAYFPGRKFPSHVYQRVGILEAQLAALEELIDADPDRLTATDR